MITFEEAINKILKHTRRLPEIEITLENSLGYVLSREIKAEEPIPRFTSSAVDGYALRAENIRTASKKYPITLPMQGIIRVGHRSLSILNRNATMKIFTGAPVPHNANAVVMQEDARVQHGSVTFYHPVMVSSNIRSQGGEFSKGDTVLKAGILITPPVVGLLATLGIKKVLVFRKPRVAVITTGDELTPLSKQLSHRNIYDANSYAITGALQSIGISVLVNITARDIKNEIYSAAKSALKKVDILISIGGISVGKFDFVKEIFSELGVKKIFWQVAIKPGKPTYFGILGKKQIFGLPGNPVSALLSFHFLVKPALRHLTGLNKFSDYKLKARLKTSLKKKIGRREFVRGTLINKNGHLTVIPTRGQDSHMLGGLARADCLIHFPMNKTQLLKGEMVNISLLNWHNP